MMYSRCVCCCCDILAKHQVLNDHLKKVEATIRVSKVEYNYYGERTTLVF